MYPVQLFVRTSRCLVEWSCDIDILKGDDKSSSSYRFSWKTSENTNYQGIYAWLNILLPIVSQFLFRNFMLPLSYNTVPDKSICCEMMLSFNTMAISLSKLHNFEIWGKLSKYSMRPRCQSYWVDIFEFWFTDSLTNRYQFSWYHNWYFWIMTMKVHTSILETITFAQYNMKIEFKQWILRYSSRWLMFFILYNRWLQGLENYM